MKDAIINPLKAMMKNSAFKIETMLSSVKKKKKEKYVKMRKL